MIFLRNPSKPIAQASIASPKNCFSKFLPNLSILEHMLLHNTNINMAIAHILVGQNKLNDRRGRSYKNQ